MLRYRKILRLLETVIIEVALKVSNNLFPFTPLQESLLRLRWQHKTQEGPGKRSPLKVYDYTRKSQHTWIIVLMYPLYLFFVHLYQMTNRESHFSPNGH